MPPVPALPMAGCEIGVSGGGGWMRHIVAWQPVAKGDWPRTEGHWRFRERRSASWLSPFVTGS